MLNSYFSSSLLVDLNKFYMVLTQRVDSQWGDTGLSPGRILFFFFFGLLRAAPTAYGSSQAKGQIGAAVAGLHHSHSNARSEPHM